MDFGLSEQQIQMQDSLRRYLGDALPLDRVRDVVAGGHAYDDTLWQGLSQMGLTGILVPGEHGGLGLPLLDAVLVQELLGAAVAPVEYTASAILAPLAIMLAGSPEQQERYLPAIADGSLQCVVALGAGGGSRDGATLTSQSGALTGTLLFASGAADAGLVLCSTDDRGLYLFDRDAQGVQWTGLRSIDDTRSLWELQLEHVEAMPLAAPGNACVDQLLAAGRIALAADTLGAAQCMLEKAVAYAGERKQFGRLIGSFQAVKHLCAEMAAELEPCRSLVWYAAHAYDAAPEERELMACHAKAHLAEVGTLVARTATEVHGGMGFTDLLGLHYWFKRIGFNRQVLGSPERLREQAAQLQGWLVPA